MSNPSEQSGSHHTSSSHTELTEVRHSPSGTAVPHVLVAADDAERLSSTLRTLGRADLPCTLYRSAAALRRELRRRPCVLLVTARFAARDLPRYIRDLHATRPDVSLVVLLNASSPFDFMAALDDQGMAVPALAVLDASVPEAVLTQTVSRALNACARRQNRRNHHARLNAENEALRAKIDALEAAREHAVAEVAERTEQVRALSQALAEAEEREQERLAHVLHDHLQQILHGAKLWADLLDPAMATNTSGPNPVERLRELLQEAMSTTRSLSTVLHPPTLDDGLIGALNWLANHMETLHGLPVVLNVDDESNDGAPDETDPLTDTAREVLFEAVRELLFNAAKHAEADYARVSLRRNGDNYTVIVEDHGRGFDVDAPRTSTRTGGLGLRSTRERLHRLGGTLQIDSTPGVGTRATVTVPPQD